ncbi:MAG: hypothetical protein ACFFE4_04050 [Candidatus Thorarchaeota archaeon]
MKSRYLQRKITEFKGLKTSRKISVIFLISLIAISQIISIIIVIVISDTIGILSGAVIPSGYVSINFDYTKPDDMEVNMPYYINNPGISDLTDIVLTIRLSANYTHNITKQSIKREIFFKTANLGTCKAWNVLQGDFEGGFGDYNISAVINFLDEADPLESFWILGDIYLKASYFIGLIKFTILNRDLVLI